MHLTRSPLFYKKTRTFPRPEFETNDFVQYTSSGVTFANTIIDELRKSREFWKRDNNIVVWNQDYHLMRIAEVCKALLREEGFSEEERQRIRIGQFFHAPFFNIHEIQGLIREPREASERALSALRNGLHLSDKLISYVEKQRRVEDWAKENIEAILNRRKAR